MKIQEMFIRAFQASLTKEKILMVFPLLLTTSILGVLSAALLQSADNWVIFGVISIPMYITFGLLGAASVFLHRIYYHELRGDRVDYKDLFKASINRMLTGTYLALPLIILHLVLWLLMGLFLVLGFIPYLGTIILILLSLIPFAFTVFLCMMPLLVVFALFFISPYFAFDAKPAFDRIKELPLVAATHFIVGFFPLLLVGALVTLFYWITMSIFHVDSNIVALTLQRFFLMIPISLYLTPPVLLFFHFALESYRELQQA